MRLQIFNPSPYLFKTSSYIQYRYMKRVKLHFLYNHRHLQFIDEELRANYGKLSVSKPIFIPWHGMLSTAFNRAFNGMTCSYFNFSSTGCPYDDFSIGGRMIPPHIARLIWPRLVENLFRQCVVKFRPFLDWHLFFRKTILKNCLLHFLFMPATNWFSRFELPEK